MIVYQLLIVFETTRSSTVAYKLHDFASILLASDSCM